MIQVYYGPGKGKTTAAAGLVLRALQAKKKVLWVSFLKIVPSGETERLKTDRRFVFLRGKTTHPFFYPPERAPGAGVIRRDQTLLLRKARAAFKAPVFLVVLDEVLNALAGGFVSGNDLCRLLDALPEGSEAVLTGRTCPERLKRRADLVTLFGEEKHYFGKGLRAREGIEF